MGNVASGVSSGVNRVIDGVGGVVGTTVDTVGGLVHSGVGGIKNACFPSSDAPGDAPSMADLGVTGSAATLPTLDPPDAERAASYLGADAGVATVPGSGLAMATASSASVPAATGEEKSGAGKVARKVTGAVVTVVAAALAISLVAKGGDGDDAIEVDEDEVEEVTVDTGKKGGNPITNAIKGFFAWGRGLYP